MDHLISFITSFGYFSYAVLFVIIFFESFPLTFFLPGDSLLFITGFFASQGYFNMGILTGTLFIASVLGYMFSYAMGQKIRTFILSSKDKYWFKKKHLDYTEEFYKKHGIKTVVIGRFIPIVRSFSPTLAGAVQMNYRQFIKLVFIGGFLWTAGLTSIGFWLGGSIPHADKYITPIVLIIILVSFLPVIGEYIVAIFKRFKKDDKRIN